MTRCSRSSVTEQCSRRHIAISVYSAYLDVGHFLLLGHLEYGVDAANVGGDFVVQLSTFLHHSQLVVVHVPQREVELRELGVKLLQTMFADYLRQRLRKSL